MALLAKGNKKLTVTLQTLKEPKFDFEGEWVGRDIALVARTIVRAYRKVQLAARREAIAANPTIGGLVTSENLAATTTTEV